MLVIDVDAKLWSADYSQGTSIIEGRPVWRVSTNALTV